MSQSRKQKKKLPSIKPQAPQPVIAKPLNSIDGVKEQLANQRLLLEDYKARYFATKGAVEMLEAVLKSMLEGEQAKEVTQPNV